LNYLKEQQVVLSKINKQLRVFNSGNSENDGDNQNRTILPSEIDVVQGAPFIENIFDFLASDFIEL
jgi:hypothetical protein